MASRVHSSIGALMRRIQLIFATPVIRAHDRHQAYLAHAVLIHYRQRGLADYFRFYNTRRRHAALDRRTPDAAYFGELGMPKAV
jgi:hypothetical protein